MSRGGRIAMHDASPLYGLGLSQGFDDTHGGISVPPEQGWFYGTPTGPNPYRSDHLEAADDGWASHEDFTRLLHTPVDLPDGSIPRQSAPRPRIRRRRPKAARRSWSQMLSTLFGALAGLIVATVSVLGWTFSYNPLQDLASTRVPQNLAQLWPLVVYGPWVVASLSILRATLTRHRTTQSWVVVVVFSSVATTLCVVHAARTFPGVVVAALPPLTAVISFHQLVRQIVAPSQTRLTTSTRRATHKAHR
ncbi:DUF2637 domain-containing protein [Kitasatospora camelliae]|uniref:DUF2637 domain-containing protein n=1 Tax=Kitasatospora camelliae TaxID=3156397 RepID=A0AAU8JWQ1_9ACTN